MLCHVIIAKGRDFECAVVLGHVLEFRCLDLVFYLQQMIRI